MSDKFYMPTDNWPEAHQYDDLENLWVYETELQENAVVPVAECQVTRRGFMVRLPVAEGNYEHQIFDTQEEAERFAKDMADV